MLVGLGRGLSGGGRLDGGCVGHVDILAKVAGERGMWQNGKGREQGTGNRERGVEKLRS